jgi:hypothetical protein
MDVAASYLSTKQMGPAGPTSEKAAKQMKNAAKNWAWEAREVQRVLSFFFSLRLVFFFITHGH